MLFYVKDIREHKSKGGKRHIFFETVLIKQISTSCHFCTQFRSLNVFNIKFDTFFITFFFVKRLINLTGMLTLGCHINRNINLKKERFHKMMIDIT